MLYSMCCNCSYYEILLSFFVADAGIIEITIVQYIEDEIGQLLFLKDFGKIPMLELFKDLENYKINE